MPAVKNIVLGYKRKLPSHISVDDMVSAGIVGLLSAVDKYDAKRNDTFAAYASTCIRYAIINDLRQWDHLSRGYRHDVKKLDETHFELEKTLKRTPTDDEIKQHSGLNDKQFAMARENSNIKFLSLEDNECSEQNPLDKIFIKEAIDIVREVMDHFSYKMRRTLELFYFEGKNQVEIAKELNVSEGRVSQLRKEALKDLQPVRKMLEDGFSN
jgi:RNA polymerase sigma factor for flagellar operon FliA